MSGVYTACDMCKEPVGDLRAVRITKSIVNHWLLVVSPVPRVASFERTREPSSTTHSLVGWTLAHLQTDESE